MMRKVLLAAALLALAPVASQAGVPDRELDAVLARWDHDPHPDLKAVVVLRRGRIVAERYYNGETPQALHDVRSAGKSVTALLVGAAIDRRTIAAVTDPVERYWPASAGTAVGDVKLADLLTMRSGLASLDQDPASPGNEDKLDEATDPLAFALAVPRADAPGATYRYNSLTAYVTGLVVEKAVGENLAQFGRRVLFAPLGIRQWTWASDIAGHTKGQGNLSLTARDFAAIGEMVRGQGVYHGRRVISAAWIQAALAPKVAIDKDDPYADGYGYFWYAKTHRIEGRAVPVSFASGNGGNKIYVVPSRDLVIAVTSSAYGHGYGQRRSEDILKALLAADLAAP